MDTITSTPDRRLDNSLFSLACDRRDIEGTKARIVECEAALAQTEEFQYLKVAKEKLAELIAVAGENDEIIRAIALQKYEADESKNKTINPSVSIAEYATFEIDEPVTIAWALDHDHRDVLQVNKVAIKKIAKVMAVDGVVVGTEARVRIASDLSNYLTNSE